MEFVLIEEGAGKVGHPDFPHDGEVREVKLSTFYMSADPVTNRDFYQFVRDSPQERGGNEHDLLKHWLAGRPSPEIMTHPVTFVSWDSAVRFCRWLSTAYPLAPVNEIIAGLVARLPTEAEWEYAARGYNDANVYPWGREPPNEMLLNYMFSQDGTTDCGRYGETPIGLRDMAGNVGEWCLDDYDPAFRTSMPVENPVCLRDGNQKVIKGGSWRSKPTLVRISFRDHDARGACLEDVGFRVVFAHGIWAGVPGAVQP